jgi:hypothetical protein
MFRNPKSVQKEVQRKRLELLMKLPKGEKLQTQKHPDVFHAENNRNLPRFMHRDIMQQNLGTGIWSSLYSDYQNPAEQHSQTHREAIPTANET